MAVAGLALVAAAAPAAERPPQCLRVTATAYTASEGETDALPFTGAWGDRLDRAQVRLGPGLRPIAVSPDLVRQGLKRGQRVRIDGLARQYVVLDRTPAIWTQRVDLFMGTDVEKARRFGKRGVVIRWIPGDTIELPAAERM